MFERFMTALGMRKQPTAPRAESASTEGLPYRPGLVSELKADHREIARLFSEFASAHALGDVDDCVAKLKRFTYSLRAHLLKENLLLYVYLSQALKSMPESSELMSEMRREMQVIGRSLNAFVTKYTTSPWDSSTREQLSLEIDGIAGVLSHRIKSEEDSLYPLYMPVNAYGGVHNGK